MPIRVDEPARVGIDRLLAAFAANRLRAPDQAAIVIDLGTAITVDLVEVDGGSRVVRFCRESVRRAARLRIKPMHCHTSSFALIGLHRRRWENRRSRPSKRDLYWGTVGAIEKLVSEFRNRACRHRPICSSPAVPASAVNEIDEQRYSGSTWPHLVLSGIALWNRVLLERRMG